MSKVYAFAGTSTLKGATKLRVANDIMRIKVLAKGGHENITMIELPNPMNKIDAARFLLELDEFQGAVEQQALMDYLESKGETIEAPETAEVEEPAAETVKEVNDDVADEVEADFEEEVNDEDLEDAPF